MEPAMSPARPLVGTSICVVRQGRALLVRRHDSGPLAGLWSLPGGHVEWGETLREAALRELREETGIEAEICLLLDSVDVIGRDPVGRVRYHYVLTVFGGLWQAGEARAGGDAAAVQWAGPDDLDRLDMTPGTAALIRRAIPLLTQT